jgi:hypothetical protein
VDAASISAIRTDIFWNWQRRDCGRSTRHLRVASHRPESTRCPLGSKADICSAQAHVR